MTKVIIKNEETQVEFKTEFKESKPLNPRLKARVEEMSDGSLKIRFGYELEDMVGLLDCNGIHRTLEEIEEAIANQDHRK